MVFIVLTITFSGYVYIVARLLCHLNFPNIKLGGLEGMFRNQQQTKSTRVCPVTQLCPTLCDPMDCSLPGSSCPWDFPGKNTGVGCHSLLQGIFLTQGSNMGLLNWQEDFFFYQLSHQGSPMVCLHIDRYCQESSEKQEVK